MDTSGLMVVHTLYSFVPSRPASNELRIADISILYKTFE